MRRSWVRILARAAFDAMLIGLVIAFAIHTSNVFERLGLFVAAWLLLTGKFLVLRDSTERRCIGLQTPFKIRMTAHALQTPR